MAIAYRNRQREEEDAKIKEAKSLNQEGKDMGAMLTTLAIKEDTRKNTERLASLEETIKRLVERLDKKDSI